jgi:hypothetical protein
MIGLARHRLLEAMRLCALIGMDTKHDFNAYHFPTLLFSFTDACNTGKVGAMVVISSEDAPTVQLAINIVRWNVPCRNPACAHNVLYHSRTDGHGWYALLCDFV